MTLRDRVRHLWRDERGFIGTTAAIAIALGTAGAQTAASIYSTKKAGDLNEKALSAQEAESQRALAFEREQAERRDKAYKDAQNIYARQYDDYMRLMSPHYAYGDSVLRSLFSSSDPGAMPAGAGGGPAIPAGGAPPMGPMGAAGPAGGAPPQMPLQSLTAPQSAPQVGRGGGLPIPMPQPGGVMSLLQLAQLASRARQGAMPTQNVNPLGSLVQLPATSLS